jgi:hypothetical protein
MDYSTTSSSASCSASSRSPSVSSASSGFLHAEQLHDGREELPTVEPIAIIGFSLKGPGDADTVESFWEMMMEARSTASEFPKERLNHAAHYSTDTGAMGTVCIPCIELAFHKANTEEDPTSESTLPKGGLGCL